MNFKYLLKLCISQSTYYTTSNFRFHFHPLKILSMNTKPPNILVYTGSNCPKRFKEVENNIFKCLSNDKYLVYHLLSSEIHKHPWMENSLLLIISCDFLENSAVNLFERYLKNCGHILLICSRFDSNLLGKKCHQILNKEALIQVDFKDMGELFLFRGKFSYSNDNNILCWDSCQRPVIHKHNYGKNILITSEVFLDRDFKTSDLSSKYSTNKRLSVLKHILTKELGLEANNNFVSPELSAGYYVNKNGREIANAINELKLEPSSEFRIFHECNFKYADACINLPIYFCSKNLPNSFTFDENKYFSKLDTNIYGHHLVYFPATTSTMEVAEQLLDYEGIVIVADYQMSGKGRGTNKWISPKGCAMFTLHFALSLNTPLGKRMSLLQHIASLAVVHSIKSLQVYKDLDLKIKWPNDIYYQHTKLGGLIISSTIQKDVGHINIGWGINVSNSSPTLCLNDVIKKHNSENLLSLPFLNVEEVVAYTVSHMEHFVADFNKFGPQNFFDLYYSYWMHGQQEVTLTNSNERGVVEGLDEFGFLKVKTDDGKVLILQPDGNRFDIMKNLIHTA